MSSIRTHRLIAVGASMSWAACVYDWTWQTECSPTEPCAEEQFCDYPDQLCGEGDKGTCEPKRECLMGEGPIICGCNGVPHTSECVAAQAGLDIASTDRCEGKTQTLTPCGFGYCTPGMEFCRHDLDADTFECRKPTCFPIDCTCEELCETGSPEPEDCHDDPATGLTVTCP